MGRLTQGFAVAVVLALSLVEVGEAREPEGHSAGETATLAPTTLGDPNTALAAAALITVAETGIFLDGFESGDTSSWSSTVP